MLSLYNYKTTTEAATYFSPVYRNKQNHHSHIKFLSEGRTTAMLPRNAAPATALRRYSSFPPVSTPEPSPPLPITLLQRLPHLHAAFPSRNTCLHLTMQSREPSAPGGLLTRCACTVGLICAMYRGFQLFYSCFSKWVVKHFNL